MAVLGSDPHEGEKLKILIEYQYLLLPYPTIDKFLYSIYLYIEF